MRKKPLLVGLALLTLGSLSAVLLVLNRRSLWEEDLRGKIRAACVGDSITYGAGVKNRDKYSYPAQLGRMLGNRWVVRNFGVSGATVLREGEKPYLRQDVFQQARDFEPNVVIIMLGTNDAKRQNWRFKGSFTKDYRKLIEEFANLPSHPLVLLCHPPPVPRNGNLGISDASIREQITLIDGVARDAGAGIIDVYSALKDFPHLIPDNIHPDADGATRIAASVRDTLAPEEEELFQRLPKTP